MADSPMLKAALAYAKKGKQIFPIKPRGKAPLTPHGFKDATMDPQHIRSWWTQWPEANIGMPTGKGSRVVVLDVDPRNGGTDSFYRLQEKYGRIPDTSSQKTGGQGTHFLFEYPTGESIRSTTLNGYSGLDIKADGGYILLPPSWTQHPYSWVDTLIKPAPLPPWLLDLIVERSRSSAEPLPDTIPVGKRNKNLASLAGSMRHRGSSPDAILAAIKVENMRCEEPLSEDELWKIAQSIGKYSPGLPASTDTPSEMSRPILRCAAEIEPQTVEWLWKPYIPLGKLTVIVGNPGVGKSFIAMTLAAIVSSGHPFPNLETGFPDKNERNEPAPVLFASVEDAPEDTLVPRLISMKADRSNIHFFEGVRRWDSDAEKWINDILSFGNLIAIEAALKTTKCKLAVFDPIQGFGGGKNMNQSHEVRGLLAPLTALAEKYHVAIFLIAHPRKSTTDRALQRLSGSVDIGAAARSVLLAGDAPQKEGERAIVHIKSNLAMHGPSLGYVIEDNGKSGEFRWTGISDLTAGDLLAPEQGPEKQTALEGATDFLNTTLEGGAVRVTDLKKEAITAGLFWRTVERAKGQMPEVKATHPGGPGTPWFWEKKVKGRQGSQRTNPP